jgi:argininosuccinate lyase
MSSKVSAFLSESIDPRLQKHLFAPKTRRELAGGFASLSDVNKAHVAMLHERGILSRDVAAALARAILALEAEGPAGVPVDGAREDSFFNYEARIIEMTGPEVGGRMHTGRSRNDLKATQDRMRARATALSILDGLLTVRETMLDRAVAFADVVMPGYTHLQPAQPITYGWYLLGFLHALERDHARIAESYPRINLNPLGAGAIAGTSYPIDRERTMRLLGFDGLVAHTLDAVASRDYLIELVAAVTLLTTTWGRLAQDFFVMTSYEFQTLELPDRVAGTSSMMPQKKNMVVLEDLKASSAQLLGALTTAVSGVKGTHFTNTVDGNGEAFRWIWDAFEETLDGLHILDLVVGSAAPRSDRMRQLVEANFSTATDLADALVLKAGLPFREAHHIAGGVVRTALDRGLTAKGITHALVREVAAQVTGRSIDIPSSILAELAPEVAAERRQGTGGPSQRDIESMVATLRRNLADDRKLYAERQARLTRAKHELDAAIAQLAADKGAT